MRVVSVLPSATEIVFALGHGDELVGRSSECDYPVGVLSLPAVMRPRTLDSEGPSRAIDQRVREARGRGESLYELDLELLERLRPDLLLTQNLCGVCSVTDEEARQACEQAGVQPRIVSLAPTTLAEVWDSFETVGEAVRDAEAGRRLAEAGRARAKSRPTPSGKVAVVEWLDPPIIAGLWTPNIITAAGGVGWGPKPAEPGFRTDWTDIARAAPDLLIVSPCSFSVDRTSRELREDAALLAKVRSVHAPLGTFLADEAYFSRPGPRLADGVDLVRTLLARGRPNGPMPVQLLSPTPVEEEPTP